MRLNSPSKVANDRDGIKSIDILGERIKLHYSKTSKTYQTRLGGLVTILIAIISLISLVYISSQYFDTSSPVVTTTRELSASAQDFNLHGKDLFPGITVGFAGVFEPHNMHKFITIQAQFFRKTLNPEANLTEIKLFKKFNYIPCYLITEDKSLIELMTKIVGATKTILLCPHFKAVDFDATISYDPQSLSSVYLSIKYYPCSLANKDECYPLQKVFGAETSTADLSNLVSPSNYTNPVVFRWNLYQFIIDATRSKSFRYALQQRRLIDDRYFFRKPVVKDEHAVFKLQTTDSWVRDITQLHCTPVMIEAGECQEFFEFVYEMSNEVVITTRRYKKIPALLGEFGGILKLITVVLVVLSLYYSKAIQSFLIEKVFRVDEATLVEAGQILVEAEKEELAEKELSAESVSRAKIEIQAENLQKQEKNKFTKGKNVSREGGSNDDSRFKNTLKEAIEAKTDLRELVRRTCFVEIINRISLKKHHRILLPLVLLNSKKGLKNEFNQKLPKLIKKRENQLLTEREQQSLQNLENQEFSMIFDQKSLKITNRKLSDYKKIYGELKKVKLSSINILERICTQKILSTLSLLFEIDE